MLIRHKTKQPTNHSALEIWRMWCTPSLLFLPGQLWSGAIAPDRSHSMGQIEQIVFKKQMTGIKL